MLYFAVGVAGVIGALLRYYVGLSVHAWIITDFPIGTLIINYIGCLVLGWFNTWAANSSLPPWFRVGFGTGLIGAFTTFSTFSVETVELFQKGLWMIGAMYILLSLFGGLLMAGLGYALGNFMVRKREQGELCHDYE